MLKSIVHIKAGSSDWSPTPEDLDKLVARFKADKVFVSRSGVSVEIFEIFPGDKRRLIVKAGSNDWDPTQPELDDLKKLFEEAVDSREVCAVVATRAEVSIYVHEAFRSNRG